MFNRRREVFTNVYREYILGLCYGHGADNLVIISLHTMQNARFMVVKAVGVDDGNVGVTASRQENGHIIPDCGTEISLHDIPADVRGKLRSHITGIVSVFIMPCCCHPPIKSW